MPNNSVILCVKRHKKRKKMVKINKDKVKIKVTDLLKSHPDGQSLDFLHVHALMESDSAFVAPECAGMLYAVAFVEIDGSIIHLHR